MSKRRIWENCTRRLGMAIWRRWNSWQGKMPVPWTRKTGELNRADLCIGTPVWVFGALFLSSISLNQCDPLWTSEIKWTWRLWLVLKSGGKFECPAFRALWTGAIPVNLYIRKWSIMLCWSCKLHSCMSSSHCTEGSNKGLVDQQFWKNYCTYICITLLTSIFISMLGH